MKELYLSMVVLCILVAIIVYCFNKSVQHLKYLYKAWKDYNRSVVDLEEMIRDFYRKK